MKIPVESIAVLRLKPGDVLVATVPAALNQSSRDKILDDMRKALDYCGFKDTRVIIKSKQISLEILRKTKTKPITKIHHADQIERAESNQHP